MERKVKKDVGEDKEKIGEEDGKDMGREEKMGRRNERRKWKKKR